MCNYWTIAIGILLGFCLIASTVIAVLAIQYLTEDFFKYTVPFRWKRFVNQLYWK